MTTTPFGASRANPPAPGNSTPPNPTARAVISKLRTEIVDAAWQVLVDLDADDDALSRACQTLIENCRDGRRDTARDILAILGDPT